MTLPGPSWLFCPGDRPDRYRKAQTAADMVILDLEDAVSPGRKADARHAMITHPLNPRRVIVRVNPVGSPDHSADLAALRQTAYQTVMLAKAEHGEHVAHLRGWDVIALVETPVGAVNVAELASAPGVVGLMWGAEDLVAAMGGRSTRLPDGRYRDVARHVRSSTLLAAHAAGRFAVDSVYVDFQDLTGLSEEARDAAASGFSYKACIHPDQTAVVRDAFRPDADLVRWAERVVEASRSAGVVSLDGRMIDAPLVAQARRVLAAVPNRVEPHT